MVQITVVGIWCTLVKDDLKFELKSSVVDTDGRWILIDATVQGSDFLFANIYIYLIGYKDNALSSVIWTRYWNTMIHVLNKNLQ